MLICDTNGGTLPHEVSTIVKEVTKHVPGKNLGIHAHNDTGNAVANSITQYYQVRDKFKGPSMVLVKGVVMQT